MNENELKERAVHSLLQSKLGKVAPAEAFVIGWRKGWDEAIDMALEILRIDILPRMNAGDSRILRFGFLFDTTKQERRGR